MDNVVTVGDELSRESIKQPWMRGRITVGEGIDRFNEPPAEVFGPNAIDEVAGKVRIVGLDQPGVEPFAKSFERFCAEGSIVASGGPPARLWHDRPGDCRIRERSGHCVVEHFLHARNWLSGDGAAGTPSLPALIETGSS